MISSTPPNHPGTQAIPAHARYSPSAMSRIIADPLSVFLSHGIESKRSRYAEQGDNAHMLGEHFLKQALQGKPIEELSIVGRPAACEVDDAMIRHCKAYAAYAMSRVRALMSLPHMFFVEKRLILSIEPQLFGTADFVFLYQTKEDGFWHLIIIDFKYGEGIKVLTEENWQLICYGLFAIAEFESNSKVLQTAHDATKHPRAVGSILDVEMHIFQPRADTPVEPQFFHRNDLIVEPWGKIQEAVKISEMFFQRAVERYGLERLDSLTTPEKAACISPEEFAQYQRAGKHCQFCRFKPQCRAAADQHGTGKVLELLGMVKPRVEEIRETLPPQLTPKGNPKKPPTVEKLLQDPKIVLQTGVLTPEDKAFIALNATALTNLIGAIKDGFKDELKNGETNPYAFLGKATPIRAFIDDKEHVRAVLSEQFGITDFVKMVPKELGITEIEERIGEGKLEALGLTKIVRETAKLLPAGSAAEPAPPRGFNTSLIVRQLLNVPIEEDEQPADAA